MNWFETITNKANKKVVKLVSFYPSIEYDELEKALAFAGKFINIISNVLKITTYTCISILSNTEGSNWIKSSNKIFDVAMDSYMGAEICDLFGLFIPNYLRNKLVVNSHGIYQMTAILENKSSCEQEAITKKIRNLFKIHEFNIIIEKDMFKTDFLEVLKLS